MTKAEWIARLRKAKVRALELYPISMCIYWAWGDLWGETANFDLGGQYENWSIDWMRETKPTRKQVAAVFDESIKLAGGEP